MFDGAEGTEAMSKTPVQKTRERLRVAIDRACMARGELQWTHGYRTAFSARRDYDPVEERQLYQKELHIQGVCDSRERAVVLAITAYARAVRFNARLRCSTR